MKINSENIDECFFDYFEGNLKDEEKLELMNFIHVHPEYEKDFAVWAQSYTIKDDTLKDYGLNPSLIKETKPSIYKPLYYIIPGIILLSCFFLFQSPKKETITVKTQSKIIPNTRPEDISSKITEKTTIKNPVVHSKEIIISGKSTEHVLPESTPIPTIADTNHVITESPVLINKESTKPETITENKKETIATPTEKEEELATKRKKKKLIDLKPSPEFIPVNENF